MMKLFSIRYCLAAVLCALFLYSTPVQAQEDEMTADTTAVEESAAEEQPEVPTGKDNRPERPAFETTTFFSSALSVLFWAGFSP